MGHKPEKPDFLMTVLARCQRPEARDPMRGGRAGCRRAAAVIVDASLGPQSTEERGAGCPAGCPGKEEAKVLAPKLPVLICSRVPPALLPELALHHQILLIKSAPMPAPPDPSRPGASFQAGKIVHVPVLHVAYW